MGTIGIDRAESIQQIRSDLALSYAKLPMIGDLWDSFAAKARVYPRLRYLYTKRDAIDNIQGGVWDRVDFEQAGVKESASDQSANLQALRDNVQSEIERLEKQGVSSGGSAIGLISAHTPGVNPGQPGECYLNQRRDPRLPWNRIR